MSEVDDGVRPFADFLVLGVALLDRQVGCLGRLHRPRRALCSTVGLNENEMIELYNPRLYSIITDPSLPSSVTPA